MKRERGQVTIVRAFVLLLGLSGSISFILAGIARAQPPTRVSPVVVSPVVQREIATGKTFVGTILPNKKAVVGTAVDGRVVEVLFEEGDHVEANQPLARLLTDTITLELEAAKAGLDFRQQQLAELENGTRPEDVERAKAKMLGSEATLDYLSARRDRAEQLYKTSAAVSVENRQQAASAALAAEQNVLEAKAAYALAVAGVRKEQIAQAHAQTRMQEALVEKLAGQIQKHTIITRFEGYVTAKRTELGQWVTKGDPVVEIVALDPVEIRAYVPEANIPFVRVGEEVHVEVPSLPKRMFTGRVALIIPEADDRSRTFPVKIRVANPKAANGPPLKAGMSARVTLPTGPTQQALVVSKDALVLGGPSPVVFVFDADPKDATKGKVRPVSITLGAASGHWIQVTGLLTAGQKVIVRGNERLRPGQDVVVSDELAPESIPDSAKSQTSAAR